MNPLDKLKGRKVLVTGGAGFIGSQLVRLLVEQGAFVIVVDNLYTGKRENLAGLPADQVELHVVDLRDQAVMPELLKRVSIVYHLAALSVRHSLHSPYENHQVNAEGALRLLEMARHAGTIEQYVHVSTSEIYGTGSGDMTEDYPPRPNTVYGAAKLCGEMYALAYHLTYGFPAVVIRPFNAYGPRCHHEGDSGEVIPLFMLRCLSGKEMVIFGDGMQTRDFTYVEDTARGIMQAGVTPACVGMILNLAYGKMVTINELANIVADVVGVAPNIRHDPPRPGDTLYLLGDSSKAREVMGFEARISLREGLTRLKDWYLSLGSTPEQMLQQSPVRNWEAGRRPPLPNYEWATYQD